MSLVTLLIVLIIIGVALTFIPMDGNIRNIVIAVVAIIALVVVFKQLGLF